MDSDGVLFIHNDKDVSRFASLQAVGTKLAKSLFIYIVYEWKSTKWKSEYDYFKRAYICM